jgi:hypothetical protein
MARIGNREFSRSEIECRIGDLRQLGGIRHCELTEGRARGVRAAIVDTGAGLSFTVLPDRGLDIADCSYKGVGLVYHAPGGIAHPSFHDPSGSEWLRVFFGGLLTTCGLTYFGDPGRDGDEELGLHGRYAAQSARQVCDLSRWEGEERILEITGIVEESVLFGDKLRLTRSISTALGARSLRIHDRVENVGPRPSPFTILYHVNAGFPLLDEASELLLASCSIEPYDEPAAERIGEVLGFAAPDRDAVGLDYLHSMAADGEGYTRAAMINRSLAGGLGLSLRYHTASLPFLNEWKMLNEVDYVVGFEPVNVKIVNRSILRAEGRLPMLEPGEQREMDIEIGVLEGKGEIDAFAAEVQRTIAR